MGRWVVERVEQAKMRVVVEADNYEEAVNFLNTGVYSHKTQTELPEFIASGPVIELPEPELSPDKCTHSISWERGWDSTYEAYGDYHLASIGEIVERHLRCS